MHRLVNSLKLRRAVDGVFRSKARALRRRPTIELVEPRILFTLDGSEVTDLPDSMKVSLYTFIGDHSVSNSEKWSMKIGDKWHSATDFGLVQRDLRDFKVGQDYQIELRHDGSNRTAGPDFDYRAWIDRYANPAWTSGATTISGTNYFVVEENDPALMQKRWFGDEENNAAGKTATLVIPGVDLDIDTGNEDGFSTTITDNATEDRDEELTSKGKWIVANTGDIDGDGVKDFANLGGIAGGKFTPMVLRLPPSLALSGASLSDITFRFDYDMSDPTGLTATSTEPNAGYLRIWTVDATGNRGDAELLADGEGVTAADLQMTFGGANATKTLYVEAVRGSTSNRSIIVDMEVDGTVWDGIVQDRVHVTPIGLQLQSVAFSATDANRFFTITSDSGTTTYTAPHWLDSNLDGDAEDTGDRKYPVAYRREATMITNRVFKLTAPTSFTTTGSNLVITGQEAHGFSFFATSGTLPSPDADHSFVYNATAKTITAADAANSPFPVWINHFDPMKINWSFSIDGGANYTGVGTSENQLYTFLEKPTQSVLYHTVAHYATKPPANGLQDPVQIANAIWAHFSTAPALALARVNTTTPMTYGHAAPFALTAAGMLSSGNGRGQCTAWADLYAQMLSAHAIGSTFVKITYGTPPPFGNGIFTVKEMPAQGSGGANYLVGTTQGTAFTNHMVLRVDGIADTIFDPSYGSKTVKIDARSVELLWEDLYLDSYRDPSGLWIGDPKGTKELDFDDL